MAKTSISSLTPNKVHVPAQKVGDAERVTRTIHVSGIDPRVTEHYLAQYFSCCGAVVAVRMTGDARKSGWVEFQSRESALAALGLDQQVLGTGVLRITQSRSAIQTNALTTSLPVEKVNELSCTIHIGGLDAHLTEGDLRMYFTAACGPIKRLTLAGDASRSETRFAFVEFESVYSAQMALTLTGTMLGRSAVRISQAKTPIQNARVAGMPSATLPVMPAASLPGTSALDAASLGLAGAAGYLTPEVLALMAASTPAAASLGTLASLSTAVAPVANVTVPAAALAQAQAIAARAVAAAEATGQIEKGAGEGASGHKDGAREEEEGGKPEEEGVGEKRSAAPAAADKVHMEAAGHSKEGDDGEGGGHNDASSNKGHADGDKAEGEGGSRKRRTSGAGGEEAGVEGDKELDEKKRRLS
eukprot:jgi/Mesvir1/15882/Mv02790-RA.1